MPQTTIVQKLLITASGAIFIALASLIASLPLNLPSNQNSPNATVLSSLNSGDTAWMIIATVFSLLLGPTLATLYANMYGKDSNQVLNLALVTAATVTFLWILFSFSLCYGSDANGDQILSFPKTYYMFHNVGAAPSNLASTIPTSIFAIFELSFAIITPIIVATSLSDRVTVPGFLFFIVVWHLTIFCPIVHIIWHPRGWLATHLVEDFSGGIVVHMLSSITILVGNFFLDHAKAKPAPAAHVSDYKKVLTSTALVWILWFGINAGKAHNAGPTAAQAIVNTIAATTSALLTWYLLDAFWSVPFTVVSIFNAVLIGVIAITPAVGFVTVGGAMVIAIFAVIVTQLLARTVLKEGIDGGQPISIATLHGVGGTAGFLATAVLSYSFVNSDAFNGLTYGRGMPLAHHIAAALALWSGLSVAVGLCFFLSNLVVPIGVSAGSN